MLWIHNLNYSLPNISIYFKQIVDNGLAVMKYIFQKKETSNHVVKLSGE